MFSYLKIVVFHIVILLLIQKTCSSLLSLLSFSMWQHKKLAEGSAYEEVSTSTPYSENDISNSIKNGILYLEDPINHVTVFGTVLSLTSIFWDTFVKSFHCLCVFVIV